MFINGTLLSITTCIFILSIVGSFTFSQKETLLCLSVMLFFFSRWLRAYEQHQMDKALRETELNTDIKSLQESTPL